jgi:hypothetical protein
VDGPECSQITLAVCGDPIIGKTLVLLLRGCGFNAMFLPVSSLNAGSLKDIELLLLTPQRYAMRSEIRAAVLRRIARFAKIPIMELVYGTTSLSLQEGSASARSVSEVPWPCSTKELGRQIEAKLLRTADRAQGDHRARCLGEKGSNDL